MTDNDRSTSPGLRGHREHEQMLSCRQHVLLAHTAAAQDRSADDWVEQERVVVATSANAWAQAHGYHRLVTVADVERIEVRAVGHFDWMEKLALYVAEFVVYQSDDSTGGING